MTRVFYDCEFLEDGSTIDLISIGIVTEDGREYYAVNSDADWDRIRANDWLVRNVLPSLPVVNRTMLDAYVAHSPNSFPRPSVDLVDVDKRNTCVKPHWVIANEVREFIAADPDPQLWAWYAAYDHVALAQLWGRMIDLPDCIPMWTNDLKQECARLGNPRVPEQGDGEHNALADARHNLAIARFLDGIGRSDA
jgi:hypothetical protein